MNKLQLLEHEMEETHQRFLALLDSIPESDYLLPTDNPAWTVGDILYHVTLGPRAISFEVWMMLRARGLFQLTLNYFPSNLFNRFNARFTQRGSGFSRAKLVQLYEAGHAELERRLHQTREEDLGKSVIYPADMEAMLAGETSVEKLFHYAKDHFEAHQASIRKRQK